MNTAALDALKTDIKSAQEMIDTLPPSKKQENLKKQLAIKEKHLKWLSCFETFAKNQEIDFDFLIIKSSQFNSGFGKLAFEEIEIEFPGLNQPCNFKKVTNALSAVKSERDKFFYLFFRRKKRNMRINVTDLAISLGKLAIEEAFSN